MILTPDFCKHRPNLENCTKGKVRDNLNNHRYRIFLFYVGKPSFKNKGKILDKL